MTDLFLIAHKVRSEPAFDVALQMNCPHCSDYDGTECIECDSLGYWWIIPTSGHRAYPYWEVELEDLTRHMGEYDSIMKSIPIIPDGLADHYPTRAAPTISLIDTLGLRKPKAQAPSTPIARRF